MTQMPDLPPAATHPAKRFEPWPWILFGLPALVVVASVVTLIIAMRSSDALVNDDYYKAGLGINRVLARSAEAQKRGLQGQLRLSAGGAHVLLTAQAGEVLPDRLRLSLTHATRPELDVSVELLAAPEGYFAPLGALPAGRWQVHVQDEAAQWRLAAQAMLPSSEALQLRPEA